MNIFMDSSITVLGTLFKSIQIHTAALVVLVNLELLVEFEQSSLEGWRSRTWFIQYMGERPVSLGAPEGSLLEMYSCE